MDIKTLLNWPLEKDGGETGNIAESSARANHQHKPDRLSGPHRAGELGNRWAADSLVSRVRDATSIPRDPAHIHPYLNEVNERDGGDSPSSTTHKSTNSRGSFSSFTSTCPSIAPTSSSSHPEQDTPFLSPSWRNGSLPRPSLLQEKDRPSSVGAAGFPAPLYSRAGSSPRYATTSSFVSTPLQEPSYPLVSAPNTDSSSSGKPNRYFLSSSPESSLAAFASIATAGGPEMNCYNASKKLQDLQDRSNTLGPRTNTRGSQEPGNLHPTDSEKGFSGIVHKSRDSYGSSDIAKVTSARKSTDVRQWTSANSAAGQSAERGQQSKHHKTASMSSQSSASSGPSQASTNVDNRSKSTKTGRQSAISRSTTPTNRSGPPSVVTVVSPVPQSGELPAATSIEEYGPKCSYTDNCSTNSPLRKVVSHIFGRNKLCTRQIPKGVWVHYCRKHYQRSRYRNPKGFALLQCDLVRKQVDRLEVWGGVADWVIKVRKREEVRLSKEKAERESVTNRPDDNSDDDRTVHSTNQPPSSVDDGGPTAAGDMTKSLLNLMGMEKTTKDVLNFLKRIETGIETTGANFPDVEILPNVIGQSPKPKPATVPRRTIGHRMDPHQRSNSSSTGVLSDDFEEVDSERDSDAPTGGARAKGSIRTGQGSFKRKRNPSEDVTLGRRGASTATEFHGVRPTMKRRRTGP